MMKQLLFSLLFIAFSFSAKAQVFVDTSYTIEEMVHGFFGANGDSIFNVNFTGTNAALGFFEGSQSNIGLNAGLLISSGDVMGVSGPSSQFVSGYNGLNGHPWLDVFTTTGTYDASMITFDVIPTTDKLRFRYVFGSEEYLEFVNSQFNDAFVFLVDGPGLSSNDSIFVPADTVISSMGCWGCVDTFLIAQQDTCLLLDEFGFDQQCYLAGDTIELLCGFVFCGFDTTFVAEHWYYSPGGRNIALIPQTNLPVTINTLNQYSNLSYFVNNNGGSTVAYDAFTTPLWAEQAVVPGETYHVAVAVTDVGDSAYDSGVFLSIESVGGDSLLPVDVHFDALQPVGGTTVQFDNNTFWATEWHWDFGDGNTSDARYPTYTYAAPGNYTVALTAKNWCSQQTYTTNVAVTTSGTAEATQQVFAVSPNPFKQQFVLQLHQSETAEVRLYDLNGKLVYRRDHTDGSAVVLPDLVSGVYTLQVISEGKMAAQLLVKE